MLAVVAVEQHHPRHVRPAAELVGQDAGGIVAAAVVDENHFIGDAQRIERRVQPFEQLGKAGLLVVHRDDDGEFWFHQAGSLDWFY